MEKIHSLFVAGKANFDHRCRQLAVGGGLLGFGASAFAQTAPADVDVSDVLLKIAAGFAAGMLVSVAFTGAYLGLRAAKLARRG